jgi:hypothetical protein
MSRQKLPDGVHYTPRNGGMYVSWNGRPEGSVWITWSKDVAYGRVDATGHDVEGFKWDATPYQGASGGCSRSRIIKLAADYVA